VKKVQNQLTIDEIIVKVWQRAFLKQC